MPYEIGINLFLDLLGRASLREVDIQLSAVGVCPGQGWFIPLVVVENHRDIVDRHRAEVGAHKKTGTRSSLRNRSGARRGGETMLIRIHKLFSHFQQLPRYPYRDRRRHP